MTGIRLKVCGMRNRANILDVGFIEPDYMGFIFYKDSPRFVGNSFSVPDSLPQKIKRVGVFVNETIDEINLQVERCDLSVVQLHGDENPEYCASMKSEHVKIVKAFALHDDFDFNVLAPYQGAVDYFLFDAKGEKYGGNSVLFNWNILDRYDQKIPFFLSGGISVERVDAIRNLKEMNIHAVDINSRFEISPGLKSTKMILELREKLNR